VGDIEDFAKSPPRREIAVLLFSLCWRCTDLTHVYREVHRQYLDAAALAGEGGEKERQDAAESGGSEGEPKAKAGLR
jgi:hypothetical protein